MTIKFLAIYEHLRDLQEASQDLLENDIISGLTDQAHGFLTIQEARYYVLSLIAKGIIQKYRTDVGTHAVRLNPDVINADDVIDILRGECVEIRNEDSEQMQD